MGRRRTKLQTLVNDWLLRLDGQSFLLLQMLARRVADLSLSDVSPELLTVLVGWPLLTPDKAIADEISQLKLSGWDLAILRLGHSQASRKRSGSFYTTPNLAARITTKALADDWQGGAIVDPACGGGAFLLAALDWLGENQPDLAVPDLFVEKIYGIDIDPLAVALSRLAVLRHLAEQTAQPLPPTLTIALAAQIRTGNALIGNMQTVNTNRVALFEAINTNQLSFALTYYKIYETELDRSVQKIADNLATLPIFNDINDAQYLASLQPFDWQAAFPEVFKQGGFAAVLGNPPYIGFNDYSGAEKAYFAHSFPQIYNLKNDLLYYFIKRGIDLLCPNGHLGFVTSRFWKEAVFAAALRSWLAQNTCLLAIEDLDDQQFFVKATIEVCLLFARRSQPTSIHSFSFSHAGNAQTVLQSRLQGGMAWTWLRRLPAQELLLAKIEEQSIGLGTLAQCRTGVQTGLDKAFFVGGQQAAKLEANLVRRAIKNANITPNKISWNDLWLIYPPDDFQPDDYPALTAYLTPYRKDLAQRFRYETVFPFYELQWPRKPEHFLSCPKIITPYKAAINTFAVDTQQFFFSTDVISIVFEQKDGIEQFAANFLNSHLSTFQFRSYGKPVGGGQWDYYANPVKKLAFPNQVLTPSKLAYLSQNDLTLEQINEAVFELYNLSSQEQAIIRKLI